MRVHPYLSRINDLHSAGKIAVRVYTPLVTKYPSNLQTQLNYDTQHTILPYIWKIHQVDYTCISCSIQ